MILSSALDQTQIGIKMGIKYVVCQKLASFMLKGLVMSSLAYKYVFYRPEHNTKGLPHVVEV